ncbi:hypothetical protein J3D57_001469 [Bacillus amyloliquefaciens]|nr:hypothetical protein [Bacillus amyloliquefaciens]
MIKRIMSFKSDDWRHIFFLLKSAAKNFFKGDFHEANDALYWIRIHLSFESNKVK